MPTGTSLAVFIGLLVLSFLNWAVVTSGLNGLHSSDAAGNAMAAAFTAIAVVVLWLLLGGLLLVAGLKGDMPRWAAITACILHPASCVAALAALELLGNAGNSDKVVMVSPVAVPLLMMVFACWAYFPAMRGLLSGSVASAITWGFILVLSIVPAQYFMHRTRESAANRRQADAEYEVVQRAELKAAREENLPKLQALGEDAPLYKWMEFVDPKKGVREEAIAGIHNLKSRQSDAEDMAERGITWVLKEIPNLNLEASPVLVARHKRELASLAKGLQRADAHSVPYSWISTQVEGYLPAIQWMAEHHCDCEAEMAALAATIRSYEDSKGRAECVATIEQAIKGGN